MLICRIRINRDSIFFGLLILILVHLQSCRGRKRESCSKYNLSCTPHWKCPKDGGFIKDRKPIVCGYDKGNILMCCNSSNSFQNATTTRPQTTTTPTPQSTTRSSRYEKAIAIVAKNCEKYTSYRSKKVWIDPLIPGDQGMWFNEIQCDFKVDLLMPTHGEKDRPTMYPHMARIGYGDNINDIRWYCDGSLISERFILSAAQCGKTSPWGPPRWVQLGTSVEQYVRNGNRAKIYEIVKVYDHPAYNPPSLYNDISLFELNATVAMSLYIRPACLFTSTENFLWWRAHASGYQQNDNLITTIVAVQNDTICSDSYSNQNTVRIHRGYDPVTMICSEYQYNDYGKKSSCETNFGAPLQINRGNKLCMWNIHGVMSFGDACLSVHDGNVAVYTKVGYYIVWIQSIVWPDKEIDN